MRRMLSALLLTTVMVLIGIPVSAQEPPAESCPPAFTLHETHHHGDSSGMHGEHKHVGVAMDEVDRNGDGFICIKAVGKDGSTHVHVDNNRR